MSYRSPVPYTGYRGLQNYDPLAELHREMDRLFDEVFVGGRPSVGRTALTGMAMPRIDIHEDEKELCVTADLPGINPTEVDVRLDGDVLTISGEKKQETQRKQEDYHVMERSHGHFRRSIQLPFAPDVEQVRAEGRHGVLTIHVPRSAQQPQHSRRIEVREAGQEGSSTGPVTH